MNEQENIEEEQKTDQLYPEPDFSNPRKDGESWPSQFQQGDNIGGPEIQAGQYDDGADGRQYE